MLRTSQNTACVSLGQNLRSARYGRAECQQGLLPLAKVWAVSRAWLHLQAMPTSWGVRACGCSLPACEGQSPWSDLDPVPAVPTQRLPRRPGEEREAHIGRALGRVAPSMLLCSLSEAVCFFLGEPEQPLPTRHWELLEAGSPLSLSSHLSRCRALRFTLGPPPHPSGALTPMPAVRTFALTSGFAVLLDFLLQMSAFVALLSLDSRRQEVGVEARPRDSPLVPILAGDGVAPLCTEGSEHADGVWEQHAGMFRPRSP